MANFTSMKLGICSEKYYLNMSSTLKENYKSFRKINIDRSLFYDALSKDKKNVNNDSFSLVLPNGESKIFIDKYKNNKKIRSIIDKFLNTFFDKMKVSVASRSFSKNKFLRKLILKNYSDVIFNDTGLTLEGNDLVKFLYHSEKAIIALETIDDSLLKQLPNLKVIGKFGVGLDKIDLNSMSKHNIKLGWEPGVNCRSVSELTLSFMIQALRRLRLCQQKILDGDFNQIRGENLTNKVIGIIGCGNVGKDLITLLKPFNCKILVYDIKKDDEFYLKNKIKMTSFNFLIENSDIITLHTPLTDKTYKFIGRQEFNKMKKNAVLINTARGKLVNEKDLFYALKNNKIDSAAVDVFFDEPPKNYELLKLQNFIISPHIGGSTTDSILKMGIAAINGLDNAQDPLNFLQYK